MNDLIFVDADGARRAHPAPEGFDWDNYPGVIVYEGRPYHYAGTTDGTPHYVDRQSAALLWCEAAGKDPLFRR